jgi:hypothetical protein
MANPEPLFRYRCEKWLANFVQSPCKKNLARIKALTKNAPKAHLGPLEHCRECRGKGLITLERREEPMQKAVKEQMPPAVALDPGEVKKVFAAAIKPGVQLPGSTPLPVAPDTHPSVQSAAVAPVEHPCPNHPDKERLVDKIGRVTGFCIECHRERGKKQLFTGAGAKPGNIILAFPDRLQDLRQWVLDQAEANERSPAAQIFYLLKQVHHKAKENRQ